MTIDLMPCYTPRFGELFLESRRMGGRGDLRAGVFGERQGKGEKDQSGGRVADWIGLGKVAGDGVPLNQWISWPASLLLVANRMAATKTTMMTGTTKKGEVMSMAQAPGV